MAYFETGVRRFQQEIINCIKEPTIVSLLEAVSVISIEDSARIKNLYLHGHTYEAGKDMLECVYNSEQPGKWESFVNALEEAEFPFLKRLVSSPDYAYEFSSHKHIRAKISLFTPWLEKHIIPLEVVPELVGREVINDVDAEIIRSTFQNQGNTYATIILLQRMQCRVSPKKWYYEFLNALLSTGDEMIVRKIEPDFLTNPFAFMPEQDSVVPDELAGDPRTLELYEAAIKEGKERDRNIRVMIVGCYGQGKTSLVRHLTGQSLEGIESTNGIEVQICEGILDTQEPWAFRPPEDVRVESVKRLATVARLIANKPPENTEHISSHFSSGNSDTHVAKKAKTGNEKHVQNKLLENTQNEITGNDKLVQQSDEKGLKSEMNVDVHTVSGGVLTMDSLEFGKEIKETNEEENKLQEKTLNINIWDFGGQFVYYATHQLFHSRQAIYILVFDIAKGLDVNVYDKDCPNEEKEKSMEEYLKFWIRSVHSFVGNEAGTEPPIFVVGTHLDMLAEHIDEDGRFEDVRKLFDGTVCAFHIQPEQFAVSNTNPNPATFADIRRAVTAYALKKSAGLFIPAKWIPLERSLKENRHLKIITFEEVKEFDRLNHIPIASEDQLKIFLQYHHEKGTFFYFENEYNAINHVVLDPQFLIDAFRCIITADKFCCVHQNLRSLWQKLRNEAILEEELLNELWKKESNKEFMKFKKPLLFFLQRHRIIAEALAFDEASSTSVPLNFYIVPSFLRKTDKGMIDDFLKGKRYTKLSIGYNFDYDSTLCTVYNRVTAAVFGRWPILKFKSTALVYENAVVCKINLTHSGILKRFNNSLELLVVNLCPEEAVSMKDCDAFRRFVEMVIQEELHKFQTKDFEKQYRGYKEIVRCYDKDHGYSGSCNVYEFETLRTNKVIGCPDYFSHSISINDMAEWFNVDIADADVPKRTLTEKELSKLSTSIGKNWENLARMLEFTDAEIEQVSMDKASTQLRIYEILKRWSAEKLDGATLDVLIHAIRECRPNLTVNSDTLKNLIEGTLLNRQY